MVDEGKYIGTELGLFQKAHNWKSYFRSFLLSFLKGDVLEVGAGIGGTTSLLCDGSQSSWVCLEPDGELCEEIVRKKAEGAIPKICSIKKGFLADLPDTHLFDAILYMDVIEHIEDDRAELEIAFRHLKKGGVLIILVPAHQFLYSPFDKHIGHFRRYSRRRLLDAVPRPLTKVAVRYLDSIGLLASLANKMLLRKQMPTAAQIKFWDSTLVPQSKIADKLFNYRIGKSLLGVWRRP
jgi:SAM-dependent methyltransferase